MNATTPATKAGTVGVGTPQYDTPPGTTSAPIRAAFVRVIADPELVAAEMLERMGPVMATAVAAALLDLARSNGRVIA